MNEQKMEKSSIEVYSVTQFNLILLILDALSM